MNSKHVKPGIQTSEFWIVAASLAVTAAHTLGFRFGDAAAGSLAHGFSACGLALITAWLGGNYISVRSIVKANPTVAAQLQDAFGDRLRSVAADLESGFRARLNAFASGELQSSPVAQETPQKPAASAADAETAGA